MEVRVGTPLVFYLLASTYLSVCQGFGTLFNRSSFAADFVFGSGSSAYQYEGAAHTEGRKPSIWDTFTMDFPGDRVKYWATLNEPNLFTKSGYFRTWSMLNYIGNCPAENSAAEPYVVAHHHLLLCHATAVKLYRENYKASQKGLIGITIYAMWAVPKFQTVASYHTTARAVDFMVGWFLDPITFGNYPKSMQSLVGDRLPKFTESQSVMVKGSIDFLGINYYTAFYADNLTSYSSIDLSYTTDSRATLTSEKNGIPIGELTGSAWLCIYPKGIREMLLYLKRKNNPPPIYITENGMGDVNSSSWPFNLITNDSLRVKYESLHLSYLFKAIKDGVDVRRYYVWSFLDNFEWDSGYTIRFGITYVDYKNGLKRYLKDYAL